MFRDCLCQAPINTTADSTMQLVHCLHDVRGFDKRQGAFVFTRTSPAAGGAHDMYRVRMTGHEILVPPVYACDDSIVVAPYEILVAGLYRVEVLQTYDSFLLGSHPKPRSYQSMAIATFTMTVYTPDSSWGCAWQESCPVCSNPGAEGRWVVRNPRLLGELKYCAAWLTGNQSVCSSPEVYALSTRRSAFPGLSWQPYSCSLVPLEDIDLEACLKGRELCFVGDSHIQRGVTSFIERETDYYERDPWASELTKEGKPKADKTQGAIANIVYYQDSWGSPWGVHYLSACTDVYVNSGHWPASFVVGLDSWPASQFALAADNLADFLLSLKEQGIRVHWVTSPSLAPNPEITGINDWRSDAQLSLYNDISRKAVEERGIPVVDQLSITDPLHDTAYDVVHFKGLVGYNINLQVMNAICFAREDGATR